MTREESTMILGILKTAYPNFYKTMTKEEAYGTIELWADMFVNEDAKIVTIAVKELINNFKFPPTIADVKDQIVKLTMERTDLTAEWDSLQKAISCGLYNSVEGYESLPPIAKAFVRSPSQLRELAMMDSDVVHSVVKGQFFKQGEVLRKRQEEDRRMLPESRKLMEMIGNIGKDVSLLEEGE